MSDNSFLAISVSLIATVIHVSWVFAFTGQNWVWCWSTVTVTRLTSGRTRTISFRNLGPVDDKQSGSTSHRSCPDQSRRRYC